MGLMWLNQVQRFYQHLCLVDRKVLRNPHCGKRQNVGWKSLRASHPTGGQLKNDTFQITAV